MIVANEARGVSGQLFISGAAPNCFPISLFSIQKGGVEEKGGERGGQEKER